jgi:hypothetical protein
LREFCIFSVGFAGGGVVSFEGWALFRFGFLRYVGGGARADGLLLDVGRAGFFVIGGRGVFWFSDFA